MYTVGILADKGYTVSYPVFDGEFMGTANLFYRSLADAAAEYFRGAVESDRGILCRALFSVSEDEDGFAVRVTLIQRKNGRRCGEKQLLHRWRYWDGRDAVMVKG